METNQLQLLYTNLDGTRHENGVEYWYAREIFPLLGYKHREDFKTVIDKAKDSCKNAGGQTEDHFRDVTKTIRDEMGGEELIPDIKLTRYACYLIALNGDPRKEEIAFAQAYFVTQTRKLEVLEKKINEIQRLGARNKLKITEKEFASTLYERGVDGKGIGEIRNAGDEALFGGYTTQQMKIKLGIKVNDPLSDVLPSVTIKAKDLATEMTTVNTKKKNLQGKFPIKEEHIKNNKGVRGVLVRASIKPEELPAEEDIKKIESKHKEEKMLMERRQKKELEEARKRRP